MLPDSGQFSTDSRLPKNDHENSFDLRQPLKQQEQTQPDFLNIEPEFTGDFLFGNEPLFESLDYTQQNMTVDTGEIHQSNQPQQGTSNFGVNDTRRYPLKFSCENSHFSTNTPQFDPLPHNQIQSHNEWEKMSETLMEQHGQQQSDTINHGSTGNSSMSMEFNSSSQNKVVMNQNHERNMYQTEHQFNQQTVSQKAHQEKQNMTVDTEKTQHNNQSRPEVFKNSGVNDMRSDFTNSPGGNDHLSPYTPQLDSFAYNQVHTYNEWNMVPETPMEHYGQQQSDTINHGPNGNSSMSMTANSSDQNGMVFYKNQEGNVYQTENQFTQHTVFQNMHQEKQNMTVDTGETQHNTQPQQNIPNSGVNDMRSYFTNSPCGNDHLSPYTPQLDSFAHNQVQAHNEWEMMTETPVEHQQQSDTKNYSPNGNFSMAMSVNSSDQNEMGINQNQEKHMYQTENQFTQHTVIHNVYPEKHGMTVDIGEVQQNNQPQQNISNSGVNDTRSYFTNSPRGNDHSSPYTPQLDSFAQSQEQTYNEWEMMSETPVEHHGQQESNTPHYGSNGNSSMSMSVNSSDQNEMHFHKNQEGYMYQTEHQFTQHAVNHSVHQEKQGTTVDTEEIQVNSQPQPVVFENSGVNDMRRYPLKSSCENGHFPTNTPQLDPLSHNQVQSHNEWEMMPETPVQHHGQQQSDTMNHGSNGNSSMSMEFNSCDQNEMGFQKNQESNMNQREHQFTQHTVHHIVQVTPSNEVITVSGKHLYPSFAEPANLQKSTGFSHVFIKCGNTVESQNEVRQIDANDTSKDNRNDKSNDSRNDTPNENCRDKKKTFTPYTPAQLEILCEQFEIKNYLTNDVRDDLAQKTGLTPHKIVVWFSNRRKRIRDKPKVEVEKRKIEATRREEAKVWVNEAIAAWDEKVITEELAGINYE